jgi:rSAM/selenodomain-associated transferase 1
VASDRCLVLFTKPAVPGRVKTRLIGELSAEEAARLHAAFVDDLVERLRRGDFDLRIAWAVDPDAGLPPAAVPGMRQEGADLGERLFHGLLACAGGRVGVAAIGSDHPDLPMARVEEAFDRLAAGESVVLGPAVDGGYYLIAVRSDRLRRELFADIDWSTPRVLGQTIERCRTVGLEPTLLAPWADVDQPADLHRLAASMATAGGSGCPRTRNLLASWGRL